MLYKIVYVYRLRVSYLLLKKKIRLQYLQVLKQKKRLNNYKIILF